MPVTLTIEKLVHGGDGLARMPATAGGEARREVVFVPFTLPGEAVEVELDPPRGGRRQARLQRVLEASPDRAEPACEYFGRCGGCDWQHIAPDAQLARKRDILIETLARTGGVRTSGEVLLHPSPPWQYRNRIRLQHAAGPLAAGFFWAHSHRILPVSHCPIASPRLNEALVRITSADFMAGERELELVADGTDEQVTARAPLDFDIGAHRYRVSPGTFFQVNRFLTAELAATVVGDASGDEAIDLYSGAGLFALPLAQRFRSVTAVESHPGAVADLKVNALPYGNLRVSGTSALAFLSSRRPETVDLVTVDPPRAGLDSAVTAALIALAPRRIHLVSCDPATLGRDLRPLLAAGYRIEATHLFDLFPQTHHLETVTLLSLP